MDLEIQEKEVNQTHTEADKVEISDDKKWKLAVNDYVTVVENYKTYGDAGDGPLSVGNVGLVLENDESDVPYQVVTSDGSEWWYAADALTKIDWNEDAIDEFKTKYQDYLDNRTQQENSVPLWNTEQDSFFQQQQQQMQIEQQQQAALFRKQKEEEYVNALTLYTCDNKFRCGDNLYGGYVISDLGVSDNCYDVLLSGGAGGNISFEKEFCDKYMVDCLLFDNDHEQGRTLDIDKIETSSHKRITLVEKNIGDEETDNLTNLKQYFDSYNNIFLKICVGGAEWSLFSTFTDNEIMKIKQMTIEFSIPKTSAEWDILKKITNTHVLVHYHANNNCSAILKMDNKHIPGVFTCTFIRKDVYQEKFGQLKLNTEPLPTSLDSPSMPTKFDFFFNCEPWVHKFKYFLK